MFASYENLIRDFEKETIEAISNRKVDEFYIGFCKTLVFDDDDPNAYDRIVYKGKSTDGNFNFEELKSTIHRPNLQYETNGYNKRFAGWITFKDSDSWIERTETSSGYETWNEVSRPKLT